MKTLKSIILAALIVLAALAAYAYSGFYDVAAGSGHTRIVGWYLDTLRERSVAVRADEVEVPADLDESRRIEAGAGHYKDMCAGCHGFPGRDPNESFGPAPPALYQQQVPAGEAFWVAKHGIKMTAMPGHGDHSDEEIWDTVAFVRALPKMSPEEYDDVTANAEHSHADGQSHDHADNDHAGGDHAEDGHTEHRDGDDHHAHEQGHQDQHEHDSPSTAEETLDAFHHALSEGRGQKARTYLHRDATVLEGGKLETAEAYAAGHMQHDMAFLQNMDIETLSREQLSNDTQASFVTQSRMTGAVDDRNLDLVSTETATLVQTDRGWRITHLSWASSPYADMPGENP